MNKAQSKQLEILLEFDRLCRENDIKYHLDGGTMLGAIRHKGFIPWDDDIDVEMSREDYEKFKKVALEKMDKRFFYQDIETDPNYGYFFAKIRMNNTKYVENIAKNVDAHSGIYMDIFPYDNYGKESLFDFKKVLILRMLMLLKSKYIIEANTLVKKIELIILKFLKLFVTRKFIIKTVEKIRKKNDKDGKYYIQYNTTYFDKPLTLRKIYDRLDEYEFEGHKFYGTYYYHEYLTHLYGDYMEFPPEEDRATHGIIEIQYDDEEINV